MSKENFANSLRLLAEQEWMVRGASTLRRLAGELDALPESHPAWAAFDHAWQNEPGAKCCEVHMEVIRFCGRGGGRDTDALGFLRLLTEQLTAQDPLILYPPAGSA